MDFNFKSQIATTREQSERLLALGLKKETANCYLFEYEEGKYKVIAESWLDLIADERYYSQYKDVCFPAWSLHRLVSTLINKGIIITFIDNIVIIEQYKVFQKSYDFWDDVYDNICDAIEWLIEEGYFNKEYLV